VPRLPRPDFLSVLSFQVFLNLPPSPPAGERAGVRGKNGKASSAIDKKIDK
jgi:hypothetical protein